MAQQGMTVVLAEHKMEWIAAFADRVVALQEGAILMDGSAREVLASPRLPEAGIGVSRYTAAARKAQQQGLWPSEHALPVTLEQAVEGFREAR
jgi:energy-coupling factor transporter ATP-binding protein EcfA2